MSHSWTDSVKSHGTSWTHSSSPLAAHTHSHTSSVRLQSWLSDFAMAIGHHMHISVPMHHYHLILWSDTYDTYRIAPSNLRLQPALLKYVTPVIEDPTANC